MLFFFWFSNHGSIHTSGRAVSISQILTASVTLAERGGLEILAVQNKHKLHMVEKSRTKEGAKEMLTNGDLKSHQAIVYGFHKAFPGLTVISEEHPNKEIAVDLRSIKSVSEKALPGLKPADMFVNMNDVTVWVDPLDATQEFTEGLLKYVTVMVCISVRGHPLAGVIHAPFENTTYWAWINYGVSESLQNLQKRKPSGTASDPVVLISRSHAGKVNETIVKSLGGKTKVLPMGGAGYKALRLIDGTGQVYAHLTNIKKWDICAANAILQAVGGRMTMMNGKSVLYHPPKSMTSEKVEGGIISTSKAASLTQHEALRKQFTKYN